MNASDTPLTSDFGGRERYDGATTTDGPGQSRQRLGTPDLAPTDMEVDMDSARPARPPLPAPPGAPYGLRNTATFLWHWLVHPRHPARWITASPGEDVRCYCGKRWSQ